MAIYALFHGTIVTVKYLNYLYIDFDLAIFVQATDQALRGSMFSSIRGMNWLGDHVSLILFVVAPIYAVARHPLTLLHLQTVVLALGALPVYALARRELKLEWAAVMLAAGYLLHPAIAYTNLFEFHPEVLATTTLLATIACMAADRFAWTIVFAVLSVLCKEDVALVVGMLGLTALLPGRPRRGVYAATLLGITIASLVLSFVVILPRLGSSAAEYGTMYKEWGQGMGGVAIGILRDPLRAVSALFSTPGNLHDTWLKTVYWPMMLGPLFFLPLLSPATLVVAGPVLAEHFLSYRPQQHGLIYQYTALVTPIFVAAAVRGLANLVRRVARRPLTAELMQSASRPRRLALGLSAAVVVAGVVCNLLYGPVLKRGWIEVQPASESVWPDAHERTQRPYRDRLVARVPREGGVVAAFEFLARLASRRDIHSLHHIYTGFFTFSSQPYPVPRGVVALLADIGDSRLAAYVRPSTPVRLRELVAENRLRPAEAAGDLVLFLRDPPDTVELVRTAPPPPPAARRVVYDGQLALVGHALRDTVVAPGGLITLETWWQRVAEVDRHFMMQLVVREELTEDSKFALIRHLGYLVYPAASWPADTTLRETYRMPVSLSLPAGRYTLGLRLGWWSEGGPQTSGLSRPDDPAVAENRLLVPLGRFTVVPGGTRRP
jgi:uncharacterized membrane protein